MEKTFQVLNALERDGVLTRYAIGGAVGATFYTEPFLTFDLDIFVMLPTLGSLLTVGPLYEALKARGYSEEGEGVNIEGVQVQFLPTYNPLLVEALAEARETSYGAVPTRVFRAEHLAAIGVQTGRSKDRQRVDQLLETPSMDKEYLLAVLKRHDLMAKWMQWTSYRLKSRE